MNAQIISGSVASLAMSSREIAELVDSRHDNVHVTIERLAERGVIALPALQEKGVFGTSEYPKKRGRPSKSGQSQEASE